MIGERLIPPAQPRLTRRKLLIGLGAGAAAAPLSACSLDSRSPAALAILDKAEALTKAVQRALLAPRTALAPEYPPGAISSYFKPNGSIDPDDPDYVGAAPERLQRLETGSRRPRRPADEAFARRPARAAVALADHPPRLRRGLELHRPMEGRATQGAPRRRGPEAAGALHRLLLRRHARADARQHRPLLRDDRPHRRLSSADHPRLRDELRAAAGRARRAAAGSGSSASSATRWRNT